MDTPEDLGDVTFDGGGAIPTTIKSIGDERELKTAMNLKKMKLRMMGLNMSHVPEGDDIEEGKGAAGIGGALGNVLGDGIARGVGVSPKIGGAVGGALGSAALAKKGKKGRAAAGGALGSPLGAIGSGVGGAIAASHELEGDNLQEKENEAPGLGRRLGTAMGSIVGGAVGRMAGAAGAGGISGVGARVGSAAGSAAGAALTAKKGRKGRAAVGGAIGGGLGGPMIGGLGSAITSSYEPEDEMVEEKKPFPTGKVDKKLSSLDKKMSSKPYGYKRSDERNRSMKISGIKDAVKRGEDPRADTRGGAYAKRGNPPEDHRDHYSSNKKKRVVKPAGVKNEAYVVNQGDKTANTPAYQGYKEGKKNKLTGEPLYKKGNMKENLVTISNINVKPYFYNDEKNAINDILKKTLI